MIDHINALTEDELSGVNAGVLQTCTLKGVGIDLPNGGTLVLLNADCGNGHLLPSAAYVPPPPK